MLMHQIIKPELQKLFVIQFFGAFNDNVLKSSLLILMTYQYLTIPGVDPKLLVTLSSGLFILPFFLFSAFAGEVSTRFDKVSLMRMIKIMEVGCALIASIGFYTKNVPLLLLTLFLMGLHSTLFGPIKYSLIPKYCFEQRIVFGNALINAGTFLAILFGTMLGSYLAASPGQLWIIKFILFLSAGIGLYFTYKLDHLAPEDITFTVNYHFFKSTKRLIRSMRNEHEIINLVLGISFMWFMGATMLSIVPLISKEVFIAKEIVASSMLLIFTLGMGGGPFIYNKIFKGEVVKLIWPICLFLMCALFFDLAFILTQFEKGDLFPRSFQLLSLTQFLELDYAKRFFLDLFLLAFFSGIFTVSQYAELQLIVAPESLSRVIAFNNILNALFMVFASVLLMSMFKLLLSFSVMISIVGLIAILFLFVLLFLYRADFEKYLHLS